MTTARTIPVVLVCLLLVQAPAATADKDVLMEPEAHTATAPESFGARFVTTRGEFVISVTRSWAPHGADRFYNLVKNGYFEGNRFFRVLPGFIAQWGIHGDVDVSGVWRLARIPDDPVKESNVRGTVAYAKPNAPDRRTTQLFINYADNTELDAQGFAPIGRVTEGMEVVEQLYAGYGESGPEGDAPSQARILFEGNEMLEELFPELDYIKTVTIVE